MAALNLAEIEAYNKQMLKRSRASAPVWTTADRLRKIRRDACMSQDKFADSVDVSPSVWRHWESGKRQPRRSDLLLLSVKIQAIYGVPSWWTLGQDEPTDILNEDADPRFRAAALAVLAEEMEQEKRKLAKSEEKLPRLDSNQEPSDNRLQPAPVRHTASITYLADRRPCR